VQYLLLVFTIFEVLAGSYMGGMNWKRPTAIKGTMNHAKTSFSTEICAGALNSVVQYLVPLQYGYVMIMPKNILCTKQLSNELYGSHRHWRECTTFPVSREFHIKRLRLDPKLETIPSRNLVS
jgi:hypothetical protein